MLMTRMHGLGAMAPIGPTRAPVNPVYATSGSGGGGSGYTVAIHNLVTSMSLGPSSPPMQVQTLPTPTGPNNTGISILCPPNTAFDPGTRGCVSVAPSPQVCPAGTTFEATMNTCVPNTGPPSPSGVMNPIGSTPGACPTGYTLGSDGACYQMATDAPFTVPAWGWLAGVGVVGYLAYHFLIAK